jgi:hypothetical protein
MPEFNSLADLEKFLNQKIKVALEKDVKKQAIKTMQEHVVDDVYDKYEPTQYKRTGGLAQEKNIIGNMINDNTLEIENIRKDEDTGRYVAPVVESGIGYTWEDSKIFNMQPFPRPFVENTAKELESGLAKQALAEGLRKQGLDIDVT